MSKAVVHGYSLIGALNNFANFTGKRLPWSLLQETP